MAAERDYGHRAVLDKLGIKPTHAVAVDEVSGSLDPELHAQLLLQTGRELAEPDEPADVVLAVVDASIELTAVAARWKARIQPAGGIWLLTPKRGQPGYVKDTEVMAAGLAAGLVDNKVCSVSDTVTGMRFVIRKADRPA